MALTTAGKHPNQCMKKGGDPARHLETQPLYFPQHLRTPRGIRKIALTRKLAASLLKKSEGLKSNPPPPHKCLQLHFSCSLGSTLQLAVGELLCNTANTTPPPSHFPARHCTLVHPGSASPLAGAGQQVPGSTALRFKPPARAHGERTLQSPNGKDGFSFPC